MKTITVTINPDGSTKLETSGFDGAECLKETEALEKALGTKSKDTRTGEYYKTTQTKVGQR